MKGLIKKLVFAPAFAHRAAGFGLWLHNFSYKIVSIFAPHAEKGGLHPKHRIMNYHQWFLDHVSADWSVLDVGCGNGALAQSLSHKARKLVGIDINPQNVAKAKARNPGLEVLCGDATRYKFQEKFDAIVLSNVLEHIEERVTFLRGLRGVSSRILVRVPLISRDWIVPYKKERGHEYRLDATHYIEYTEEEFDSEIAAADLQIVSKEVRWGELYAVLRAPNEVQA